MNKILKEIHGDCKKVTMTTTNLNNGDKRLVVTVDGVRYTLSKPLSDLVRKHEVTVDQLGDYQVRVVHQLDENGNEIGEPFFSLGMPSDDIVVTFDGWSTSALTIRKEVTIRELEALIV